MQPFKTISMVEPELVSLLSETAAIAATKALIDAGSIKPYITKQDAYRRAGGRRKVDDWIRKGVLKVHTAGIELAELNAILASANLATYLHTRDKKK